MDSDSKKRKIGLDFFYLAVTMDDKVELLEAEYGLKGFAIIVKLLQRIYGGEGYYCDWNDRIALLFAKKVGASGGVVREVVCAAIREGIFDKKIFDKYGVLTSHGIQTRYFEATKRRKKVEVKSEYLLVHGDEILGNVYILADNVDIIEDNVDILEQSKVKKSKAKESKAEKTTSTLTAYYDNPRLNEVFCEFLDMRKAKKVQNTQRSIDMLKKKIKDLPDDLKITTIEESIMNGWRGLFPDKFVSNKKVGSAATEQGLPKTDNPFLKYTILEENDEETGNS